MQILPKSKRPEEVNAWLKRHRKFTNIPSLVLSDYVTEVRMWWISLQPQERVVSDGEPLLRQVSEDTDWSILTKSGPNGFFIIMLVLAWWVKSANTPGLLVEFNNFMGDVNWALTVILKPMLLTSGKRSHTDQTDDEDEEPPKKR